MEGEDQGRQDGSWHSQSPQDHCDQKCHESMHNDVDQMVAQGVVRPELMLNPEGRVRQWVVLLSGARIEPNAPQSLGRAQIAAGDVAVVVPEDAAVPGWIIGCQRCSYEQEQQKTCTPTVARAIGSYPDIRHLLLCMLPCHAASGFNLLAFLAAHGIDFI